MNPDKVILLLEHNGDDICLLKREFARVDILNPIQAVSNAAEAVCYLHAAGEFCDRRLHPLPSLLIINVHIPQREGFLFLSYVREELKLDIPIVALGESDRATDVHRAYDLGANAFYAKGVDIRNLVQLIQALDFVDEIRQSPVSSIPELAFATN
jgi:CheY-like chemotaxis protein